MTKCDSPAPFRLPLSDVDVFHFNVPDIPSNLDHFLRGSVNTKYNSKWTVLWMEVLMVKVVTYIRTSFLLSLGRNLTLKLLVVTSPGYFLSSRFSWSSSSPSDEVYEGAVYSTWRKVKVSQHEVALFIRRPPVSNRVWLAHHHPHSLHLSIFQSYSTSSWSSSLTPLGLVKSSGPSHSGWVWPWDKVAPMCWEDEDEEGEGSAGCRPSLFVFFMLRSKVPFSSTSMSDSCRVQIRSQCNWSDPNIKKHDREHKSAVMRCAHLSSSQEERVWLKASYLGAGLPGLGAEGLWSLPAAGGQVEDGCCCHVGCLCILAVVITAGGRSALRKASRHTVTGGGGLREWFSWVGMEHKEFTGASARGADYCADACASLKLNVANIAAVGSYSDISCTFCAL